LTDDLGAEEWLVVAEQELARTRRFLAHDDVFAAYCLESAVDTYLRAYYCAVEVEVPADVRLCELARHAVSDETPIYHEACERIARQSAQVRSGADPEIELDQIRASLDAVEPMLVQIRDAIRGPAREET
jgi:hypothetical protein